jgi:hypothetical protein
MAVKVAATVQFQAGNNTNLATEIRERQENCGRLFPRGSTCQQLYCLFETPSADPGAGHPAPE